MKRNERRFRAFLIALTAVVAVGCGTGQSPVVNPVTPSPSTSSPTPPPSASVTITASPNPVRVGNAVYITVQVSVSEPLSAMALDLGDGTAASGGWTVTSGSQSTVVAHVYASRGDFTVTATVTTAGGAVARGTLRISVIS